MGREDESFITPKIIPNFLSDQEIDYINTKSDEIGFNKSMVENQKLDTKVRTSTTCWLNPKKDKVLEQIYKRIQTIPEIQDMKDKAIYEDLQIVNYQREQEYKAHYDQCHEESTYCRNEIKEYGGPRKWTFLIYLKDDCEGGETYFPRLGLKIKPKRGDAILFHSLTMDNRKVHPLSFHQGMPVLKGEKRIANVWIRVKDI